MKAAVHTAYGLPEVLHIKEVAQPTPRDDEVLIKVAAASVNRSDWENLIGKPLHARIGGLLKPRHQILGSDIAGRVEMAGRNSRQFQSGNEVFGHISSYTGGFAKYVCVPETAPAPKPASLTFEEAAAIPEAALTALQGIRDKGQVQPGQQVLINGAGGGAGTFAVQLAKLYGAEVTGVDTTEKLDLLRSLGADHVIDYTQEDFTKAVRRPLLLTLLFLGAVGLSRTWDLRGYAADGLALLDLPNTSLRLSLHGSLSVTGGLC